VRRIVYADSLVDDADGIAEYIEKSFGARGADVFISRLARFCELVSDTPGLGRTSHGCESPLYGVVHEMNWVFYQYDDLEVRFVHIIDGRRDKSAVRF
jgi:plasmid stabilization system protein ParE